MLSELFGFRMLQTYNVVFVLSTGVDKQCLNYREKLKAKTNIFEKFLLSPSPEIAQDSLGSSPPGAE